MKDKTKLGVMLNIFAVNLLKALGLEKADKVQKVDDVQIDPLKSEDFTKSLPSSQRDDEFFRKLSNMVNKND